MSRARGSFVAALVLAVAVVGAFRWSRALQPAARLDPGHLSLVPGEEGELTLVGGVHGIVALGFRVRFDPDVVEVEPEPVHASVLEGGRAILLPVRRSPGVIDVPGVAVTGGRVFKPAAPLYRLRVRASAAGTTSLAVEDLTVVDLEAERRTIPVAAAKVEVAP